MFKMCRTCLVDIKGQTFINLQDSTEIKTKLSTCVPELALDLVTDSVLCTQCVDVIHLACRFKNQCLHTEKVIQSRLETLKLLGTERVVLSEIFTVESNQESDFGLKLEEKVIIDDETVQVLIKTELDEGDDNGDYEDISDPTCFMEDCSLKQDSDGTKEMFVKVENAPQFDEEPATSFFDGNLSDVSKFEYCSNNKSIASVQKLDKREVKKGQVLKLGTRSTKKTRRRPPGSKKMLKCDQCKFKTTQPRLLDIHFMKLHAPLCPICHAKFKNDASLALHMDSHDSENLLEYNFSKYYCVTCGKAYLHEGRLAFHIRTSSKCKGQLAIGTRKGLYDRKVFTCDLCQFSTMSKRVSLAHKDLHTSKRRLLSKQRESSKFTCTVCRLVTVDRAVFKEHIKTHNF